ncbi:MAG: DNA repair protein RecN [Anaerolineae bacterium]|nr:DNA repair protein RecN [Anaerolineae bacterium]
MLTELRVRDFVIIDSLDLSFNRGLNVITGETGAGKSILIDSIALLLGDKADPGMVRVGAEKAIIEGDFSISAEAAESLKPILSQHNLIGDDSDEHAGHVVLAREVRNNGRTVCRVNGSAISQGVLREIGEHLVDVHGQSEHLSLLRVKEHVNLLDSFAGTWELRKRVAAKVTEWRNTTKQREAIEQNAREQARRLDMLNFQMEEIRSAKLKPNEEAMLQEEHTRLANAEALSEFANEAYSVLYDSGDRHRPAALDQIAQAGRALTNLARFDKQFEEYYKSLNDATAILEEIARSVRDYRDGIEFNPKRLEQVEARLELQKKLKRKYGDSIEAVLAYLAKAEQELDELATSDERIDELKKREKALQKEVDALAADLTNKRKAACKSLAGGVDGELSALKMGGARFEVSIAPQPCDATGADRVEFMIAPNLGEGLKPLAKVASGGETARLMLALKAVLARSGSHNAPTLIFDEVDQGIGGRVGTIVGQKLWNLTHAHQVLCITHLPQLASFGDAHFRVEKQQVGQRTRTNTVRLEHLRRQEELAQMLGTSGDTGLQGASQLLDEAQRYKSSQ